MKRRWRLLVGAALLAPCIVAAGCLPYAYPKLSYLPGAELGSEASDVHAFRVDVTVKLLLFGFTPCEYSLSEIAPNPDGRMPSKMGVTIERGAYWIWSPFEPCLGLAHENRVRLYRPGYHLIELSSWDFTDKVVWQPASAWSDQIRALTDLIGPPQLSPSPSALARRAQGPSLPTTNPSLQTVSNLAWERLLPIAPTTGKEMCVFDLAIAECERLEKCAPTPEDATRIRALGWKLIERKSAAIKPKE
jgi:hypothetical protein